MRGDQFCGGGNLATFAVDHGVKETDGLGSNLDRGGVNFQRIARVGLPFLADLLVKRCHATIGFSQH